MFVIKFFNDLLAVFGEYFFPESEDEARLRRASSSLSLKPHQIHNTIYTKDTQSVQNISALFSYKDKTVRSLISDMKFKNKKYAYKIFGRMMHHSISKEITSKYPDTQIYLIPVPIHIYTRFMRGYNQTDLLCREILKYDKQNLFVYMPNIIKKNKITKSQKHLGNRTDRLENLKESFSIKNHEKIRNKVIVIIDDVSTTGATFHEITNILNKNNPREIYYYAIAH